MRPLIRSRFKLAACLWLPCLGITPGLSFAASVETFVLALGGQSQVGPNLSCATFRAPAAVLNFFGPSGVSEPTDGLSACGIGGGYRTTTAAVGTVSDSTSLNTTFNSLPSNTFTGSASAHADYGKVGAQSHAEFIGPSNGLIVEGTEAYGLFRETGMVPSSPTQPNGTPGTIRFTFTVDGSLSVNVPPPFASTSDVEVTYQQNAGPIYTLMRAQINDSVSMPFIASGTGTGLSGFTLAPGSVSGSGAFDTFDLPIVFGMPFDFTLGLLAYTIPGPGGVTDSNFYTTAALTGIQLFVGGQPVTDFLINADSTAVYGPTGVLQAPVPLPGTLGSLAPAIALLLGMSPRSRRRPAV